jgi:hypothetical protein
MVCLTFQTARGGTPGIQSLSRVLPSRRQLFVVPEGAPVNYFTGFGRTSVMLHLSRNRLIFTIPAALDIFIIRCVPRGHEQLLLTSAIR